VSAAQHAAGAAPHPARLQLDDLLGLRRLAERVRAAPRRQVSSQRAGPARSRALGRGLDFAEVREYLPGDDLRQIDWNVTARTGKPHTKLFIEERERPVFICVDLRASMRFGTRGSFKSVAAGRLAALLAWSASADGDRVGGLVFADGLHRELKPTGGHRGVGRLAQALVEVDARGAGDTAGNASGSRPGPSSGPNTGPSTGPSTGPNTGPSTGPAAGGDDLVYAMARLRRLAHTGASIYLISDFRDFDPMVEVYLNWLIKHNEFIAVHISDPLERELPPAGRYPLRSADGRVLQIDTAPRESRHGYHGVYRMRQMQLQRFFAGRGNWYAQASTGEPLAEQAERVLYRQRWRAGSDG